MRHWGMAGVWRDGDFNYSGVIDYPDYVAQRDNYGQSLTGH